MLMILFQRLGLWSGSVCSGSLSATMRPVCGISMRQATSAWKRPCFHCASGYHACASPWASYVNVCVCKGGFVWCFYAVNDMLSGNETRSAQTTDKERKASNALLAWTQNDLCFQLSQLFACMYVGNKNALEERRCWLDLPLHAPVIKSKLLR